MILSCTCDHAVQDAWYGKGNRVHNPSAKRKEASQPWLHCTVCGIWRRP